MSGLTPFEQVIDWLVDERVYQNEKFAGGNEDWDENDSQILFGVEPGTYFDQQLMTYLGRMHVLGLDTPAGRQAAGKFVATAVGMLESVIRVFGPLPRAGVPSGEIKSEVDDEV